MKWLAIVVALLLTLFAAVYILLFTGFGNDLVAPLIASRLERKLELNVNIENFKLRIGRFALALTLEEKNRVEVEGSYALFSQSIDAKYRIRFDDLQRLKALTRQVLKGHLHSDGIAKGTLKALRIEGKSNLAQSDTVYRVTLDDFNPSGVHVEIKGASMATLLHMVDQKPYADAQLDFLADLTSLDLKALAGDLDLHLSKGGLNRPAMEKDFNLNLPETHFSVKTVVKMDKSGMRYTATLASNLAHMIFKGSVIPESLKTTVSYDINIKELALFKPITNATLRGPFATSGIVKKDQSNMIITGRSDVAGSDTTYDLRLKELKPERIVAKIKTADLKKMLYLCGQPNLISGKLDLDLKLDSLDLEDLQGKADIQLSRGVVNIASIKKHYGIALPKTSFSAKVDALLAGKDIRYDAKFVSNLAKIGSSGTIAPQTLGMDLAYNLAVTKLELVTPVTGMQMRGPLELVGTVNGDKKHLRIKGQSDQAAGQTHFDVEFQDFKPKAIQADIKHLKLKSLFSMLALPSYADGTLDVGVTIDDAQAESLTGRITTTLSNGKVDVTTMTREFDLKVPKIRFNAETTSILKENLIDTAASVTSSLASLNVKRARFNVKEALLTSDYRVDIPDLDKLYLLTERHLDGAVRITGEIKQGKDLDVEAHADTLGGAFDAKLHNDDLHADLKNLQTMDMMKMLIYPQVFESSLTGILDYNLKTRKGKFDATLPDGRFVPNVMTILVDQLAGFDLSREQFGGNLAGSINGENIVSKLAMRSNHASVTGDGVKLNTKTKQIDARLHIVANDNPIDVNMRGHVSNPKVEVDVKNLLQREAEKYIEKQVGPQFEKLLKGIFK